MVGTDGDCRPRRSGREARCLERADGPLQVAVAARVRARKSNQPARISGDFFCRADLGRKVPRIPKLRLADAAPLRRHRGLDHLDREGA